MAGKVVLLPIAAGLTLAGCRPAADEAALPANEAGAPAPAADPGPAADVNASVALDQLAAIDNHLPPPLEEGPPGFTGRWAADEARCTAGAWRFSERELRTPAGTVCRFDSVSEVPGGYSIAARCTAGRRQHEDRLEIRFAESAQAMLFDSHLGATGLVRCGEPPSPRRRPGSQEE